MCTNTVSALLGFEASLSTTELFSHPHPLDLSCTWKVAFVLWNWTQ